MHETIVIHSASSRDIWPEDTKAIAEAVQKLNSEFEVRVEDHECAGVGVTWFTCVPRERDDLGALPEIPWEEDSPVFEIHEHLKKER